MIVSGEQFEAISSPTEQVRMDSDAVKAYIQAEVDAGRLSQAQSEGLYKTISFVTLRTNRKDPALKQKWIAPTLSDNTTPEYLVDELGAVRERMALDKKTEGFLKEALDKRFAKAEEENKPKEEPGFDEQDAYKL